MLTLLKQARAPAACVKLPNLPHFKSWWVFPPHGSPPPPLLAKLWVREGDRRLGLACWHIQVRERNARQKVHAQAQQAWTLIEGLEGPARVTSREVGHLMGGERPGRASIQDRASLVLLMGAAAARRKGVLLPGPAGFGSGGPPRANRVEGRGPPRRCSAASANTHALTHATAQRVALTRTRFTTATRFGQRPF